MKSEHKLQENQKVLALAMPTELHTTRRWSDCKSTSNQWTDAHRGIFASPTESVFAVRVNNLPPDDLQDWLTTLSQQNTQKIQMAKQQLSHGWFKTGTTAEMIMLMCVKLNLPAEARYLALELFDRFMVLHIQELHKKVYSSDSDTKTDDWKEVLANVKKQEVLRVLACCQVASKLTCHYKIVTARKVYQIMTEFGFKYRLEGIVQAELRLLKTLDYRVLVPTPHIYLETLLQILTYNIPDLSVGSFHAESLMLLDLCYMRRTQIYDTLFKLYTNGIKSSKTTRLEFAGVENDLMLQSTSIIACAVYIVDEQKTAQVIDNLNHITKIPTEEITDFAEILSKEALS